MTIRQLLDVVPPSLLFPRLGHIRRFRDSDGLEWVVREVLERRERDGLRGWCLVFRCGDVLQPLREYPHDWHTLDEAALEQLLLQG